MVKEKVDKENTMFARLRNPAKFPAQLTFFPAQLASKIVHNVNFFPAPCQNACMKNWALDPKELI